MINPLSSRQSPQKLCRFVLPLVILVICCGLLWQRVAVMDMTAIGAAILQVSTGQWALAIIATWCSFQAIGRYDAIWHKLLQTGVSPAPARRAGIKAIAIAQTLGFGAITGSLVRWRCLPALSLWQATQLSFAVTMTFTLCWAAYAIGALWWLGSSFEALQVSLPIAISVLAVLFLIVLAGRRRFFPALSTEDIRALIGLTGVDLVCAAFAFYVLLPETTALPFASILAAYIVALGVGLVSNTPGGAGAFDLTVLTLLPLTTPEPLVAAIIAFRFVYYIGPALLALAAIARPVRHTVTVTKSPAAWGLARQSGELYEGLHIGKLPMVQATLGPFPRGKVTDINQLFIQSLKSGRTTALYNCDPRTAKAARDLGWYVRRTTIEAMIRPQSWSPAGGKRQTLRRKLRHAEQAGISITQAGSDMPLAQMRQIANAWALSHGGELGFSMGRYCPIYVARQRVFLINKDDQLIGFVTFHEGARDWSLDLIRHIDGIPDGAIQSAIVSAIDAAKSAGVAHFSLASVPDARHTPAFWSTRRAGLTQFKRSFGPIWVPRYHAAPGRIAFWFSGFVIAIAVYRPIPNMCWKLRRRARNLANSARKCCFAIEVSRQT